MWSKNVVKLTNKNRQPFSLNYESILTSLVISIFGFNLKIYTNPSNSLIYCINIMIYLEVFDGTYVFSKEHGTCVSNMCFLPSMNLDLGPFSGIVLA